MDLEWTDVVAIFFTLSIIYGVGNDVVGTNPNAENVEKEFDECIGTSEGLSCRNYLTLFGHQTEFILVEVTYGVRPMG